VAGRPVFVSYSQPDREVALALVARVEEEEMPCWVAPRDVTPAADWAAEIIAAIAAARVLVLVFSANANASPQVHREVERAVHRRIAVLPFRVEDVLPSPSLEYFLSTQHWLDAFPPPMAPHFARLCTHLQTLLQGASAGARAGGPPAAPPAPTLVSTARHDPAMLEQFESALAAAIGPIAKHLVRRAAVQTAGVEDLIRHLAAELESDSERRQFIDACRQALRGRS
jgi:TIR domain